MKILYDDQIFTMQKYGGISRYFAELLNIFGHTDGLDYELTTRFTQNGYAAMYNLTSRKLGHRLTSLLLSRLESKERFAPYVAAKKQRIDQEHRERLFRNSKYDIFHPTYYDPYFLELIAGKPLVVTAYDMIHELFPEMYADDDPTPKWKRLLFARADRIIAISENTKKDLIRIAGVPEAKIVVVYLASSINPEEKSDRYLVLPDKYILFVGERIRYKNFSTFIRSISGLLNNDKSLYVVCAGGGGLTDSERQLFTELRIEGQVLQYTVDDGSLALMYRKAALFVFPSLYEGFGMPVLEAFSCGCPVVLSNTSSFPEVARDAAMYVEPLDEDSIRHAIETVLNDRETRAELVKAGLNRAGQFSWAKAAIETREVYGTLV